MKLKRNKLVLLFLIFSLLVLSANLYAKERRGAKLIITKLDGQLIKGELIAVKPNSLLLLDTEGKDVSVDIADIKVIRTKKSQVVIGALGGTLTSVIGAAVLLGLILRASVGEMLSLMAQHTWKVAPLGAIIGATIGALVKETKKIQLEGMSDSEIQETMDKLRKKARIRDYR